MIVIEKIFIDNEEYQHTYSDAGFYIERDGIEYEDAIDPIEFNRVYVETNKKIEEAD